MAAEEALKPEIFVDEGSLKFEVFITTDLAGATRYNSAKLDPSETVDDIIKLWLEHGEHLDRVACFTLATLTIERDGLPITLESGQLDTSGYKYVGGTVYRIDELPLVLKEESAGNVAYNLEGYSTEFAVRGRGGTFYPFFPEKDEVVPIPTKA